MQIIEIGYQIIRWTLFLKYFSQKQEKRTTATPLTNDAIGDRRDRRHTSRQMKGWIKFVLSPLGASLD